MRRYLASVVCAAALLVTSAAPAEASGPPLIAGDPYHNACALDSYGVNTTTITDGGHLHMTDPASGGEIGDAYFFYTPSCHGFFITTLWRAGKYYVNPTLWPSDLTSRSRASHRSIRATGSPGPTCWAT
jgi:hypothetical protein